MVKIHFLQKILKNGLVSEKSSILNLFKVKGTEPYLFLIL